MRYAVLFALVVGLGCTPEPGKKEAEIKVQDKKEKEKVRDGKQAKSDDKETGKKVEKKNGAEEPAWTADGICGAFKENPIAAEKELAAKWVVFQDGINLIFALHFPSCLLL